MKIVLFWYVGLGRKRARKIKRRNREEQIMEKKKALLILSGGRAMPNMLTVIHEKPELIVALVSQDEIGRLQQLRNAIAALFRDKDGKPELNTSYIVNAFDLHDIQKKCWQVMKEHSDYNWIFNITAATKIMSIGAYEVAKELADQGRPVRCWYLNTSGTQVVSLIGEPRDSSLFHIEIGQYGAVYNCRVSPGILEDERQYCQDHWIPFSRFLVQNPQYIDLLKDLLDHKIKPTPSKSSKGAGEKKHRIPITNEIYTLLETAYKAGLLDYLQKEGDNLVFKLCYTQFNFLNGPWLEAYVWDEANKIKLFSDCQWNQKIIDENKLDDKDSRNELDVAMIYKAQLLIAECKTGDKETTKAETLYKLDSVAGSLGGKFVSRILVSSQSIPNGYEDFKNKAHDLRIVLVDRDNLSRIGEILEKQAKCPDYPRM
jgi:Domain of unknown function (DUF1887)